MTKVIRFTERELTPPQAVADNARRGLELRAEHGRGGTDVGKRRAEQLSAREQIDMTDMKSMYSYFARHTVDKRARLWGHPTRPSTGYIAWMLWGGDEAQEWVTRLRRKYHGADQDD